MAPRSTALSIAVALLFVAAQAASPVPAHGQDRPEEGTVFTGETNVLAVDVPVQVLVDGKPVRGLTADDFTVYDGRERRSLTDFEVVDLSVAGGAGAGPRAAGGENPGPAATAAPVTEHAIPAAGRRHFLLLFDLSFTEPGYLPRAIEGARKLVETGLHPSDLVGVAFYSERRGASLVLQFTPDREEVETVLDAFASLLDGKRRAEAADAADARSKADPLGLTSGGWTTALVEVGQAAGYQTSDFAEALEANRGSTSGLGGAYADNILAHSAALMEQVYREQRGAQVSYLADSLRELAHGLRSISGSKHLILFSQGFDSSLFTSMSNWGTSTGSGAGSWVLREFNDLVAELQRSGWIVHGADLKGIEHPFEAGGSATFKGSLFSLADATGGVLIENVNDLAAGLEDVLERTSVTYVLTFQVEDAPADGSFHPIRVELTGGPRGARLVHREGYFAPRPAAERDPLEVRAEVAARLLDGEELFGLPARLVATSLAYRDGRARVPVLVEVAEPRLLERGPDSVAAEVYVYAFDAAGAVADFFAHSVSVPSGVAGGEKPLLGVKLTGELTLAPGHYDLRALVRSPGTGREAMRTATLEVPAPGTGPHLLPPLFVQGAAERWVVATVGGGGDAGTGADYPFTVEGKSIAPAAVPVFAPGETARLLLPGLGLAGGNVRLESRVVTAAGDTVKAGRLEILGRRPPEAGQPDLLVARLDPSGLPPGAYALEVTLAGDGQRVRAPFEVRE